MKKKILIVDDEEKIRNQYKRVFLAVGGSIFDVQESSNGLDANKRVMKENYDVVLLDIRMPGIDGRWFYDEARKLNPAIDIIVASVFSIDQQKKMIPGARDYFDKSKGLLELLEKVTNLMDYKQVL